MNTVQGFWVCCVVALLCCRLVLGVRFRSRVCMYVASCVAFFVVLPCRFGKLTNLKFTDRIRQNYFSATSNSANTTSTSDVNRQNIQSNQNPIIRATSICTTKKTYPSIRSLITKPWQQSRLLPSQQALALRFTKQGV
jgi:hypothetical protein